MQRIQSLFVILASLLVVLLSTPRAQATAVNETATIEAINSVTNECYMLNRVTGQVSADNVAHQGKSVQNGLLSIVFDIHELAVGLEQGDSGYFSDTKRAVTALYNLQVSITDLTLRIESKAEILVGGGFKEAFYQYLAFLVAVLDALADELASRISDRPGMLATYAIKEKLDVSVERCAKAFI